MVGHMQPRVVGKVASAVGLGHCLLVMFCGELRLVTAQVMKAHGVMNGISRRNSHGDGREVFVAIRLKSKRGKIVSPDPCAYLPQWPVVGCNRIHRIFH